MQTTPDRNMKNTYYRVKDGVESPMLFETLEQAIEYLKDCLYGIDIDSPVSIEKTEMTADQFNQLPEL